MSNGVTEQGRHSHLDQQQQQQGWQREFNPPRLAEEGVGAVTAAVERSRLLPTAAAQQVRLSHRVIAFCYNLLLDCPTLPSAQS